jgi:hypothetical protein
MIPLTPFQRRQVEALAKTLGEHPKFKPLFYAGISAGPQIIELWPELKAWLAKRPHATMDDYAFLKLVYSKTRRSRSRGNRQ